MTDDHEVIALGNGSPYSQLGEKLGLEGIIVLERIPSKEAILGGYQRCHVIIRRIDGRPFPADDQLELLFYQRHSGIEPIVQHTLSLRQGALESQTSFLAPSYAFHQPNGYFYWSVTTCKILRGGRELKGLETIHHSNRDYSAGASNPAWTSIGIVNSVEWSKEVVETPSAITSLMAKEHWLSRSHKMAHLTKLPRTGVNWPRFLVFTSKPLHSSNFRLLSPEHWQVMWRLAGIW